MSFGEEEEQFKQDIRLNPGDAEAICALGDFYLAKAMYDLAEYEYQKALQHDSFSAEAHLGLGAISHQQKRVADAEYHTKKVSNWILITPAPGTTSAPFITNRSSGTKPKPSTKERLKATLSTPCPITTWVSCTPARKIILRPNNPI